MRNTARGILFLFFLVIFLPGLKAQVRELGIRGGAQVALFLEGTDQYEEAFSAFYAGVYADHAILMSGFLSFSPGLEYMQAGHRTDSDSYRRIHYLSVPLGVRGHFGPWFLQTGISANFRVAEKLMVDNQDMLDDANRTRLFDLPFQAGAGVNIGNVTLEGRFHFGFLEVNQGYSVSYLQVGLGFRL